MPALARNHLLDLCPRAQQTLSSSATWHAAVALDSKIRGHRCSSLQNRSMHIAMTVHHRNGFLVILLSCRQAWQQHAFPRLLWTSSGGCYGRWKQNDVMSPTRYHFRLGKLHCCLVPSFHAAIAPVGTAVFPVPQSYRMFHVLRPQCCGCAMWACDSEKMAHILIEHQAALGCT